MCGIVGILGKGDVAPAILDGLKRLEYRGYDSAGIATLQAGKLDRRRAVGKLSALAELLASEPIGGKSGIGHTRWATHGAAVEKNAHPHQASDVAVVHNGIIENFKVLRDELRATGTVFLTDTDTEVIAHLCQDGIDRGQSPQAAVMAALKRLDGAFALAFLFAGEDDLMIAARRGSPLAIGYGAGEMYIGSDALALAPLTTRISYLDEGDCAVLTRAGAQIFDAAGKPVSREVRTIQASNAFADKAGHEHFMAKEMHEQPLVIAEALTHYSAKGGGSVEFAGYDIDFTQYDRVMLVACGTGHIAAQVAKYWFESTARLPAETDIASEFRYREPPIPPRTLAVFISQSGETADTLAALNYARGKAARIISLVNVEESSIARASDVALPIFAGLEVCVASTKAFTCQLTVLACLTLLAARQRGALSAAGEASLIAALGRIPGAINQALGLAPQIAKLGKDLSTARSVLYLGRGTMYPIAMEGALKLKELSYIHAEGYPSGELKHGPIALIDEAMPVVVIAPSDAIFGKSISNMQEVMARGGKVLLISDAKGLKAASDGIWRSLKMPDADPFTAPILYALPAQMLAYYTALTLGTDIDQPRNLAKSVTVE